MLTAIISPVSSWTTTTPFESEKCIINCTKMHKKYHSLPVLAKISPMKQLHPEIIWVCWFDVLLLRGILLNGLKSWTFSTLFNSHEVFLSLVDASVDASVEDNPLILQFKPWESSARETSVTSWSNVSKLGCVAVSSSIDLFRVYATLLFYKTKRWSSEAFELTNSKLEICPSWFSFLSKKNFGRFPTWKRCGCGLWSFDMLEEVMMLSTRKPRREAAVKMISLRTSVSVQPSSDIFRNWWAPKRAKRQSRKSQRLHTPQMFLFCLILRDSSTRDFLRSLWKQVWQ